MNRLFDDVFRSLDGTPFAGERVFGRGMGWPNIEVSENEKEMKVTAELPGLDEKDLEVELANGVLAIKAKRNRNGRQGPAGQRAL